MDASSGVEWMAGKNGGDDISPPPNGSTLDGGACRYGRDALQQLHQNDGEAAGLALVVEFEVPVGAIITRLAQRIAELLRIGGSGAADRIDQDVHGVITG